MPFNSSSCLIAVTSTSSTVLNKRGESRHPCQVPDLKGNAFVVADYDVGCGLSYMAFIVLRNDPSIPTLLTVFIINGFYQLLFLHLFI